MGVLGQGHAPLKNLGRPTLAIQCRPHIHFAIRLMALLDW